MRKIGAGRKELSGVKDDHGKDEGHGLTNLSNDMNSLTEGLDVTMMCLSKRLGIKVETKAGGGEEVKSSPEFVPELEVMRGHKSPPNEIKKERETGRNGSWRPSGLF